MQICTLFKSGLSWKEQLQPLMGADEVMKLDLKLKEMNITTLDSLYVFYSDMFPNPPPHAEHEFTNLLRCVGAWPTVRLYF